LEGDLAGSETLGEGPGRVPSRKREEEGKKGPALRKHKSKEKAPLELRGSRFEKKERGEDALDLKKWAGEKGRSFNN